MSNKTERGNLSFRFPNAPAKIASKHVASQLSVQIATKLSGAIRVASLINVTER